MIFDTDTGTFQYTPTDPGYVGTDTFTYTVSDGQQGATPAEGTVTLTLTNALPVAGDGSEIGHMNLDLSGNVVFGDTPDAISGDAIDPLTVVVTSQPTHGTVIFDTDTGSFTYTPEHGYVGEDSFTYSVSDGQQGTSPAVGTVTFNLTNMLPVATDSIVTTELGIPVGINVSFYDIPDPVNGGDYIDPVWVLGVLRLTRHGTVTLNPDGSFTYTPDPGFVGTDNFTYGVIDAQRVIGEGGIGTVTITINDLPPLVFAIAPIQEPELKIAGCPALASWLANELGTNAEQVQVMFTSARTGAQDIQPCDSCARLQKTAMILMDSDDSMIPALARVVNAASAGAPPSEEQMAVIAVAMENPEEASDYALAKEWLDAMTQYVTILTTEIGLTIEDATAAVNKYTSPVTTGDDAGLAAYISARLAEISE